MNFLDLNNKEAPDQRKTPQWKRHNSWSLSLSHCLLLCFQRFCDSFKWDSLQLERDKAWAPHTYDTKSKMASRNEEEEQERKRQEGMDDSWKLYLFTLPTWFYMNQPSSPNVYTSIQTKLTTMLPCDLMLQVSEPDLITIHLPAAFLPFFGNTAWRRHIRGMTAMWTLWNAASGLLLCLYCTMEKGTQQLANTERPNQRGKSIQHYPRPF